MDRTELKERTKRFALSVIQFTLSLPKKREVDIISRQLVRSATSIGANYRAACRARSKAEFISKLGIVEEEADEASYWLELLLDSGLVENQTALTLLKEANELVAIFVAAKKTAKSKSEGRSAKDEVRRTKCEGRSAKDEVRRMKDDL